MQFRYRLQLAKRARQSPEPEIVPNELLTTNVNKVLNSAWDTLSLIIFIRPIGTAKSGDSAHEDKSTIRVELVFARKRLHRAYANMEGLPQILLSAVTPALAGRTSAAIGSSTPR